MLSKAAFAAAPQSGKTLPPAEQLVLKCTLAPIPDKTEVKKMQRRIISIEFAQHSGGTQRKAVVAALILLRPPECLLNIRKLVNLLMNIHACDSKTGLHVGMVYSPHRTIAIRGSG